MTPKEKQLTAELQTAYAALKSVSIEREKYKRDLETLAEILKPHLGLEAVWDAIDDLRGGQE